MPSFKRSGDASGTAIIEMISGKPEKGTLYELYPKECTRNKKD